MAKSKSDTAVEYTNYGMHCLKVVRDLSDPNSRMIHREMAAEWFRLADQSARHGAALRSAATLRVVGKDQPGLDVGSNCGQFPADGWIWKGIG